MRAGSQYSHTQTRGEGGVVKGPCHVQAHTLGHVLAHTHGHVLARTHDHILEYTRLPYTGGYYTLRRVSSVLAAFITHARGPALHSPLVVKGRCV